MSVNNYYFTDFEEYLPYSNSGDSWPLQDAGLDPSQLPDETTWWTEAPHTESKIANDVPMKEAAESHFVENDTSDKASDDSQLTIPLSPNKTSTIKKHSSTKTPEQRAAQREAAQKSRSRKKEELDDLGLKEESSLDTLRDLDLEGSRLVGQCEALISLLSENPYVDEVAGRVEKLFRNIQQNPYKHPMTDESKRKKRRSREEMPDSIDERLRERNEVCRQFRVREAAMRETLQERVAAMETYICNRVEQNEDLTGLKNWLEETVKSCKE